MPAKKGSKKLIAKQSLLGLFQKNKKLIINMEQKIKEQENTLEQLRVVYEQDNLVSKDLTKKIDNQRRKVRHKRSKLRILQAENVIKDCEKDKKVSSFSLSSLTSRKRKTKPTNPDLNLKAKQVRRNETITACNLIHGSSTEGMLDIMTSKF